MHDEDDAPDLYEEIERRALFELDEDEHEQEPAPDLIRSLSGAAVEPAGDRTLGGYIDEHNRVPAFDGSDGQPYTVDVDVEEQEDGSFTAFLIFIRWAETGAGIMDHVESGDVATGPTADEARRAALELSLYEIKSELDAAIARRRAALEE